MSDPVAEKSAFLCMYMTSHPETLIAWARWYGKVKENIASAQMTGIDSKSMTLNCTLQNGDKKTVSIPISPPLKGYEDVKDRLLEMKALAQEGLGMIQPPRVPSFKMPVKAWPSAIILPLLIYLTWSPMNSASAIFYPAQLVYGFFGGGSAYHYVAWGTYYLLWVHALECVYTASLCWKHRTGLVAGVLYVLATELSGFVVWKDLRKRIQAARIDAVMKIQ